MLKASTVPNVVGAEKVVSKPRSAGFKKRAQSVSPQSGTPRATSPAAFGRKITERRCHSLSPTVRTKLHKESRFSVAGNYPGVVSPTAAGRSSHGTPSRAQSKRSLEADNATNIEDISFDLSHDLHSVRSGSSEKEPTAIPHCLMTKLMRLLATKRREFIKLRKSVVASQNNLLEQYAAVKDLESRAGVPCDASTGEIRVVSVSGWPAHDLLLLVRKDLDMPMNPEINGFFGGQILQQLHAQMNPIPEEVLEIGAEIMARRIDLLNLLRGKHRADRSTYLTNLEWRAKNTEFDEETERLHRLVVGLVENLKAKLNYSLSLAKISWLDRDSLIKKVEKLQKENMVLQHRVDEIMHKKDNDPGQNNSPQIENTANLQTICEELSKEKSAREALKDVVSSAESMLRVARARIATLERQLKDARAELDLSKRKQKDLEQLVNELANHNRSTYRHRETSYDARSKKLLEVSKTGEITIETLSRQRDALELRVKELREQAEASERISSSKQLEQKNRLESLQAKVNEHVAVQERIKKTAELRIAELENKVKEVEEQYRTLQERSVRLVDTERRRCLEFVPSKESEPSDRETEIWKELQVTRVAMSRAEEELRQSRADKDSFLNSLNRIAQGEDADSFKDKMVMELLDREQKIVKLQHTIDEQRDNEKLMEQSMTQYENQLAALRLEVKRLRNYDCYSKEIPFQELQTELLELHMQVETLSRERTALVTAAASRALMLERHERSAELFARMTRARRDLAALIDGRTEPPLMEEVVHAEDDASRTLVKAQLAAKKLGILSKVQRYFTPEQLLTLYQSQVRSCMEYCSHLWDGSAKYLEALKSKSIEQSKYISVSRSLSSVCASAAETWTALRAERARVLRLESAVLAQSMQLEREGRVRTQLERRRAILERELLRAQHSAPFMEKNTSLAQSILNRHRIKKAIL